MRDDSKQDFTQLLDRISRGDDAAEATLMPMVYKELHVLAGRYFKKERPEHTLQPTALVHEAYIKLAGADHAGWENRYHFMAVAAKAMRQILTDYARRKRTLKRQKGEKRITLLGLATPADEMQVDLILLDEALKKLAERFPRQCRIVELRYLGGMTEEETARILDVNARTVQRDWRMAKAFLRSELSGDNSP